MKYSQDTIRSIIKESVKGLTNLSLEKKYGIPRSTICYWLKKRKNWEEVDSECSRKLMEKIIDKNESYNLILGLYLGDGCISKVKKTYRLRIAQDSKYPLILDKIKSNLENFFEKNITISKAKGCYIFCVYEKNLNLLFPQHGVGKKHDRKIELDSFQIENINYKYLCEGLWISDGSYYKASGKYESFNFTNKSEDIIKIFEDCLNFFTINYRKRVKKSGIWIIEITKRSEVEKMKNIVNLKS